MDKWIEVVPTFDDKELIRSLILKYGDKIDIVCKPTYETEVIYIDTPNLRYIAADKWYNDEEMRDFTPKELREFMRENGDSYSYISPSSFAMSFFKKWYSDKSVFMWNDGYMSYFSRLALYGGRTEALYMGKKHLFQYDINSSYPTSAYYLKFPDYRKLEYIKGADEDTIIYLEGVSQVTFSQEGYLPVLPLRHSSRILYPITDSTTGVYTHTELRYAMSQGVKIGAIHKTYAAPATISPFREVVEYFFMKRLKTGKSIYKRIINSLFGRMCVLEGKLVHFKPLHRGEEHKIRGIDRMFLADFGVACLGQYRYTGKSDSNPLLIAMIMSDARNKLHKLARRYEASYIATDMFATIYDLRTILPIGRGLGQFKAKEGDYWIKGSNEYTYTDNTGNTEIKLAGISKDDRTIWDFQQAVWNEHRKVDEDGNTQPLEVNGGMQSEEDYDIAV